MRALTPLASLAWLAANLPGERRYRAALADPRATQAAVLARHLRANAGTAFGRAYRFAEVRDAAGYRARVPLATWDDLRPWVDRAAAGEPGVLTRARVLALETTSGSSAAAKRIPYTAGLQRELRRAVAPWIVDLYRRRPRLALGCGYWSITPPAGAMADPAPAVVPAGFEEDAEYLGGAWKRLVDATLAVPGVVRLVRDLESFRYVTLLLLLHRRDLALVSVWHPSFLLLLFAALVTHWEALVADVERGTLTPPAPVPAAVGDALRRHLRPSPRRAAELRRLGPDEPTLIWPRLALVSCWGDGHAALSLPELERRLPGVEVQPKGLLATEAFVTLPYAGRTPLAVRSHFFEFIAEGGGEDRPRLAHELEPGGRYSVVVTTGGGLYRYRLEDRVEVDGFVGRTPSLRFLGKEGHVSDLCGEKLSEGFVAEALARTFAAFGLAPRFALLAPETAGRPCYALYLETGGEPPAGLAGALDDALAANPHYRYCRALGQLAPARVRRVAGAYPRYVARCQERGQRLGDVKPLALSNLPGWAEVFPPHS